MSLIPHLLRWDVRRFRILLPIWLLLVAGTALLEGAWPSMAVAMASRQTVGVTGNLLALAEVLFSVAFIVLVVQEHPLIGTSAFWMTRPIPPSALLMAKVILLCAAVVVAPVVAEVVLMIIYDVPARQIAFVALQTGIFRLLWLSVVMGFAALTPNMAKFALAVGAVIVSIIVSIATIAAIMFDRLDNAPPIPMERDTYDPTSGMMTTLLLIAVVAVLLVSLYRTRVRRRALVIGVAGVAFAIITGGSWPWPWLAPRAEVPAWALESSALQLSIAEIDAERTDGPFFGDAQSQWRVIRARMHLSGVAPGWSAGVGLRDASIRVKGREALTRRVRAHRASVAIDDAESVPQNLVIRQLLNVTRLVDSESQQRAESAVVMVARSAELRQLGADRAEYEGTYLLSLIRHDIQSVLPLRSGAAVRTGGYQFTLDRIRRHASLISLLVRQSDARSMFNRQSPSRLTYYLRNPVTSEAIRGVSRELRGDVTLAAVIPFAVGVGSESENDGFRALAMEVNFPAAYGSEQPRVVLGDTWVERGELIVVRSTDAGHVERRLSIADFPIRTE